MVTKSHCVSIQSINKDQVAVQDANGFTVLNVTTQAIDFKIVCQTTCVFDLTIVDSCITLPRLHNGIIFNFGEYQAPEEQSSGAACDSDRQTSERQILCSLNAYRQRMDKIYAKRFPGFYLCLDEFNVDLRAFYKKKLLPVKLMMPDYVHTRDCQGGFPLLPGTESYK